jgi:hypothetical protein
MSETLVDESGGGSGVRVFRYGPGALNGDFVRAGIGLGLSGLALGITPPGSVAWWIMGPAFLIFLVFGLQTLARTRTRIVVGAEGVGSHLALGRAGPQACGPFSRYIPWEEVKEIRLRFFPTRRDRSQGYMQLKVKGSGTLIAVEPALEDFSDCVGLVWQRAREAGVATDPATFENLKSLGIVAK